MSRNQRSTALYPHPFSKAYWRDAAADARSTRILVIAALMIALRVATKGLAVPIAPGLDLFNLASFINALSAMIIGPVMAIPAAIVSDFLGCMIWDGLGAYFLPYVLQEIGSSLIWALLLYRAKATPWRVMVGRFLICMIVNVLLGTGINMLYQVYYYGNSSIVLTWPRVIKNVFMFPIESVVMTLFLGLMIPITTRMGLTFGSSNVKESMKFGKPQLALLAVLFVVGCGSVFGYLNYHYETTSLSANYSAEDRLDKNRLMQTLVVQECDDFDNVDTITIVESAMKPFLKNEITYTAAIYTQNEGLTAAEAAKCWGLSKSKAAKHEGLTRAGTAIIVVDGKTGEVLSFSLTK